MGEYVTIVYYDKNKHTNETIEISENDFINCNIGDSISIDLVEIRGGIIDVPIDEYYKVKEEREQ